MYYSMKYGVGYCSYQADHVFWPQFVLYTSSTVVLFAISLATFCISGRVAVRDHVPDGTKFEIAPTRAKVVATHWFVNVVAALIIVFVAVAIIGIASAYFSTQHYFDSMNDSNFGFLLKEGEDYTAPVFVGEFGTGKDSEYFQQVISYLASRDLDWAFWPLNPVRPRGGSISASGFQDDEDPDEMIEDEWSFLGSDWVSVRYAWMAQGIMHIMRWPAMQAGDTIPCNRLVDPQCGG